MLPIQRVAQVAGPTLILGGAVWDGSDSQEILPSDVLIENGVISRVGRPGSVRAPDGAQEIDARGNFVIPGLVDMHIHLAPGNATELCVAAGVTTVRDLGNYSEWIFGLREAVRDGRLPGPRIFATGEIIEGRIPCRRGFARVTSPNEARIAVRAILDRGADGLKLYQSLPADIVSAAVDEAHRLGSWIAGHLCCMNFINAWYSGENVTAEFHGHKDCEGALEAGVEAGIDTLEHAFATSSRMLNAMVERGVALCPTLACGGSQGGYRDPALLGDLERVFENPYQVAGRPPNTEPSGKRAELWYEAQKDLVSEFHRAGGRVHAGTDSPFGVAPGFGLHSELELLRDCGLTSHEILLAATRHAAETLRVAHLQGTIEPGQSADLVILTADPLDDIANTRKIDTVIQAGRIYDREKLKALGESKDHYTPKSQPVTQNGGRVAYEARGSGPALAVLADGPGGSAIEMGRRDGSADWFSLSELSLANRVLFVDPVGTGHSDPWTNAKPLVPDDMAESVDAVCEAENVTGLTVIAHGAGALTALAYAHRFSSSLDRLILVSPTVNVPLHADDLRRIRDSAGLAAHTALDTEISEGIYDDTDSGYREAYWRAARNVLGSVHQPFELMLGFRYDSPRRHFQWRTYRDLWKPQGEFELTGEWSTIDALSTIESLSIPLLVMAGAYDAPAMRQSSLIVEANPDAQRVTFQESGHFPFVEEPDRFMRAVRAFGSERHQVTDAWIESCSGDPNLAKSVDRGLADGLKRATSFNLARSESSGRSRFTFIPALTESTAGTTTLSVIAGDSGATPGEITVAETFTDTADIYRAVRRLSDRLRVWAGDVYGSANP